MKTLAIVSFLFSICLLAGCDSDSLVAPESIDALSNETLTPDLLQSENKASQSNSNVYTFAALELVGTSKLVRNANGVSFNVKTTGLNSGNAYTLWVVVFNNPNGCNANGCNGDEFEDPNLFAAANIDVMYGAGSLAGGTGKATFSGNRSEGDNSGSIIGPYSPGLIDSELAEIHLVVRDHGSKIPGSIQEQIGTFNGGCPPNSCEDVQFAVHLPE